MTEPDSTSIELQVKTIVQAGGPASSTTFAGPPTQNSWEVRRTGTQPLELHLPQWRLVAHPGAHRARGHLRLSELVAYG